MCNRLTVKLTKFQQSSVNRFWKIAEKLRAGGGGGGRLPLIHFKINKADLDFSMHIWNYIIFISCQMLL